MMKRMKCLPVLLSVCLLLASCQAAQPTLDEPEIKTLASGRFVEQKTALPELSGVFTFDQVAEDTYYVLGTEGSDPTLGVWHSEDGGYTWEKRSYPSLSGLEVFSAAFGADGSLYVSYVAEIVDDETFLCKTAFVSESGMTDVEGIPELEAYNSGMLLTQSGDLVLSHGFSLEQIDLETGKTTSYELKEGQLFSGSYVMDGDVLVVCAGSSIMRFDTATGESLETLPVTAKAGFESITGQQDGSGYFYCNSSGLYRVTMDGAITEQLIDGSLATFGMPSAYLERIAACSDGSFLLMYYQNENYHLSRYVFDPDMPREPSQELTLYSLRDDDFVRQVVGLYQRDNPDVMVRYQVGVEEGGAVTADDAMRTLSAELLAGSGPDILVLDGLPIDSYIGHNALMDLRGPLGDGLDHVLPAVAGAFQQDDSLPAIPTRVSIPVVAGVGVESIHSMTDLADYVEQQEQQRIGMTSESAPEYFSICIPRWFGEDGALNTEALTEDLTAMKRLITMGEAHPFPRHITHAATQAIWWSGDGLGIICGPLTQLEDMVNVYAALEEKSGSSVKLFPDETGGVVIPSTIFGVNARSEKKDTAVELIRLALQTEAQSTSFWSGMSVTVDGLQAVATSKEPGAYHSSGGTGMNDGSEEFYDYNYVWPTVAQMEQAIEMVKAASAVSYADETMMQILTSETEYFWTSGQSVEDTVSGISQKVERYLQERG